MSVLFLGFPFSGFAESFELTVRDTIGKAWEAEPICWELELKPGQWNGKGGAALKREGKPLTAQATIIARREDGSAAKVEVRFIIDRLAKDAATTLSCEFGHAGPKETDLRVEKHGNELVLSNAFLAVRINNRNDDKPGGNFSPILGVRTASGKWNCGGTYETQPKPVRSRTELLEQGPVRLAAKVTTTFDNSRTHSVTLTLLAGSHSIEIEESFDLGPDDKYQFKSYESDKDELAWEWWSWYGDTQATEEDHPNYWTLNLSSEEYHPAKVRYRGDMATDADKGDRSQRGESGYTLGFSRERRFEKYLAGHCQWRPDSVLWYATSSGDKPGDDCLAVFTHSVNRWRNPNILPAAKGISLRTGTNDMRIGSYAEGKRLAVRCPIGLGQRTWAVRSSTVEESFAARDLSSTALTAEIVQRCLGLDVTRKWVTDWTVSGPYPRLFIKPEKKDEYFARLKGQGVGNPGHAIDTFLRNQDQPGFDILYKATNDQADQMLKGYFSAGMDNTTNYPGWMLGYWHGIIVASGLDNLLGSPLCKPEQAKALRKKLAILTYCLTSKDAWSDKQINYGWGSMNMPVGRWGGLVVMASAISDHPMAATWLKDSDRYFRMLLETEYNADGVHISCPHYIGASSTSFYAWLALANSGRGEDVSKSDRLRNFARYYMQLMTPIDARWGIRTLLNEGDTRPGSSPFPGILAGLFRESNPELAGQLMQVWMDGGRDVSQGMGVPDMLIIDTSIPLKPPTLGPEVFPGFGAVLRYRQLGTREEAYLTFLAGNFMIDHTNSDQMAFCWYEKGVPLTLYTGDMYVPGAVSALSHNTLAWDVQPEGAPTPGKGQPGDWYHDRNLPWIEHKNRPRIHFQIGWDKEQQDILETRGMVTMASDLPAAALVEGRVRILSMAEVPTRPDYSTAMQMQIALPQVKLDKPFTWTRRLLYVKDQTADGMNYVVVRDDLGGFDQRTPSFSYWSLSEDAELSPNTAHFKGQLGVDTDIAVISPANVRLFKDSFTHSQCEGIVGARHQERFKQTFSEKQVVARIEGERGKGFLVVIFPRKADEPRPAIEPWLAGRGAKITWKGMTYYALLDTRSHSIEDAGLKAETSCLILKVKDAKNYELSLPADGQASYHDTQLEATGNSIQTEVIEGKVRSVAGKNLLGGVRP